jgi:hypothetical protein
VLLLKVDIVSRRSKEYSKLGVAWVIVEAVLLSKLFSLVNCRW